MFKEAISAVTSSVVGAAKRTLNEYRPTNAVAEGGAFDRLAHQGIVNMSYRSPMIADMAQTMLQSFQVEIAKKQKIKNHVKSNNADSLREAVKKDLGSDASSKKIDAEMESILSKMNAMIEKSGAQEAKKSDTFAKYGKFFESLHKSSSSQEHSQTEQESSSNSSGVDPAQTGLLKNIETNTLRTYNALEEYMSRQNLSGGTSGGSSSSGGGSFIDPITGMPSISAAVGHVGGSFLGKVFDDATIDKFAKKTKTLFGFDDEEEKKNTAKVKAASSKRGGNSKSVADILGDLNLDLNTDTNKNTDVVKSTEEKNSHELKKISQDMLVELKTLNENENKSVGIKKRGNKKQSSTEKLNNKISSKNSEDTITKSIQKAQRAANYKPKIPAATTVESASGAAKALHTGANIARAATVAAEGGGLLAGAGSLLLGTAGSMAGGALMAGKGAAIASGIGSIGAGIASGAGAVGGAAMAALPALGVAGAGAAGYLVGDKVINPLLDKGLSSLTGKDTSLGSYLYDLMNSEDSRSTQSPRDKVAASPSKVATTVSTLVAEKEKIATSSEKAVQPIVISNGSTGAAAPITTNNTNIASSTHIRNQESTFERVQMQDFWPRTA